MELSVGGLGVHAVIHRDYKKTKLVFLQMLIAAYFRYICEFFSHKIVNMFFSDVRDRPGQACQWPVPARLSERNSCCA